jgi:integrase
MPRLQGIYEDKKRGTWRYQFEVAGRVYGRRGFATQLDAVEAMALHKAEVMQGYGVGGRDTTFERFVNEDFLPSRRARVKQGTLRSSSLRQIESDLRSHLLPTFGKRPLADIDVWDAERFGVRLSERGMSNSTVKRAMLTGGAVMKLARKYRLIPNNPFADADKPSPRPSSDPIPSLEQVYALADAMPSRETRALILFLAFTGARKSEAFGLRWDDVDLTEGDERVRIERQFYKGEWVERPKTNAGRREILLAPPVVHTLRELSVAQQVDDRPNPLGLVFPAPRGSRGTTRTSTGAAGFRRGKPWGCHR